MLLWTFRRTGLVRATGPHPNQCNTEFDIEFNYDYRCVMLCGLDIETGYIADHQNVDELIRKLPLLGSCEKMAQAIGDAATAYLQSKDHMHSVKAWQALVTPIGGVHASFARTFFTHSEYLPLLQAIPETSRG